MFDSINIKLLWPTLWKNGFNEKSVWCVKSRYKNVKTRVRSEDKITEYVNCIATEKQEDVCSPVFLSLFINDLALQATDKGSREIWLILWSMLLSYSY